MDNFVEIKNTDLSLHHKETFRNAFHGFLPYALETFKQVIYQSCLIPSALFSVFSYPKTRRTAMDVLIVSATNVLPIVAVSFTRDRYQNDFKKFTPFWNSYAQEAFLLFTYATTLFLIAYFKAPMLVRNGVLTISSGKAIKELQDAKPMTLCKEAKCSILRFLKGEVRDYVVFYATEAFIFALSFIPFIGQFLNLVLGIPHRGRYILSYRLSDLCQRHQVVFLTEYSEISLALGIVHFLLSNACALFIERYSKIPSEYYYPLLMPLVIPFVIAIAAQIKLPKAVKESHREIFDPLLYFQSITSFVFDIFSLGLKKKMEKGEIITLNRSLHYISLIKQTSGNLSQYPFFYYILKFSLAKMFQSKEKFLGDAIIKPNWIVLRSNALQAIDSLFAIRNDLRVRLILLTPDSFFKLGLHLYFDIPPALVGLVLQAFRNKELMLKLLYLRSHLDGLDFDANGHLKGFWGDFEYIPQKESRDEEVEAFEMVSVEKPISDPYDEFQMISDEEVPPTNKPSINRFNRLWQSEIKAADLSKNALKAKRLLPRPFFKEKTKKPAEEIGNEVPEYLDSNVRRRLASFSESIFRNNAKKIDFQTSLSPKS